MGPLEFIAVVAIYLEIAVLSFCDYKLWRTMYTPLNMLMLPYAAILFITLMSCGNMGIVEFYYPSLLLWMIGLLLFAVPSYIFGVSFSGIFKDDDICKIDDNVSMGRLNIISVILILLFLLRFVFMLFSSPYLPGSEEFGTDYAGKGLWGHLHRIMHALTIIYIYKYDKNHKYYLFLILGMFCVTFIYGVKSWVVIPAIAGICMRLYSGKMQLKLTLFIKVALLAFVVFFITYSLSLLLGRENSEGFETVFMFICRAFVHYIISGLVGWSMDLQMGILENPNFDVLLANILNLYNVITGNEYVYAINPFFLHNGINGSNVRSFFGTIYVNSNLLQFILLTLFASGVSYMMKVWAFFSRSIFVNVVYFFIGGMLIMGWFDYFLYTLPCLEVPAWVLVLYLFVYKKSAESTKKIVVV